MVVFVVERRLGPLLLRDMILQGSQTAPEILRIGQGIGRFCGGRLRFGHDIALQAVDVDMAIAAGIFGQILLVILLGRVIVVKRHHFRDDRRPIFPLLGDDHRADHRLVDRVPVIDAAAVLPAPVRPLPVQRRWVDHFEKIGEQGCQRNLRRIIADENCLGMTGIAVTHLLVGRVVRVAIGVAHLGPDHAPQPVQIGLQPPETAAGQPDIPQLRLGRRGDLLNV